MKIKHSFFLFLVIACSTRPLEKDHPIAKFATQIEYRLLPLPDQNEKFLTIHGKEIWVRDEPTTGKVVMKLNEGNRCKIKSTGYYEIIRNTGDFWYSIEFNGKSGWVFGSQTDKKLNAAKLSETSPEALWKAFKTFQIDECRKINVKSEDAECIVNQGMFEKVLNTDENKLQLMHAHMNPQYHEYRKEKSGPGTMTFIAETQSLEGSAGWFTTDHFYVGFKEADRFSLALPELSRGRFDGAIDTILQISPSELILVAVQKTRGVAYYSESYFNIYRIDLTSRSIQSANLKLGKAEGGFSLESDTEEGEIRVKSSRYEFVPNKPIPTFRLLEYKMKKKGEGFEDIPKPAITNFAWEKVQKKFVTSK